jgi:hypothetical protein
MHNMSPVAPATSSTVEDYKCTVQIISSVVTKGGVMGLVFRGLPTKIMINGVQSAFFTVLWKLGQELQTERNVTEEVF